MDGYLGPDWNMSMEMMGEYPIPVSDFHHIPEYNEATGYQVPFNTEVRAESSFQQYPLQLAGEAVPHDYAMQQQQHQHGVVGNGGSDYDEVGQHVRAVGQAFRKKKIEYGFTITRSVGDRSKICRCYILPLRIRDDERGRLAFLQIFNSNRSYNQALRDYRFKMSVVSYDPKHFHTNSNTYPNVGAEGGPNDGSSTQSHTAPFSPTALDLIEEVGNYNAGHGSVHDPSSPSAHSFLSPLTPPEQRGSPSPASAPKRVKFNEDNAGQSRTKLIPRPRRGEVHKNENGKFECTVPGCTDRPREFIRKCEWNKHMDKHDRPYHCEREGCEKLPGFTYTGGLLRHEREVHNEHGGPKNLLNCPHTSCKRYLGKGFSRLENLNEHLRRCHTAGVGHAIDAADVDVSDATTAAAAAAVAQAPVPRLGDKRKAEDEDPRDDEVKRLRMENRSLHGDVQNLHAEIQSLRGDFQRTMSESQQQTEALKRQLIAAMNRMAQMQNVIDGRPNPEQGNGNSPPSSLTLFDESTTAPY
ncbi:putative c2h2 transcription factor protein [Eutypa lata UCREL1]|uniref:Putative c2h2 transcription factor protein n=1 Tax=Eutypa lata (strain UCR-EL1) TaxID=1287681 RepID=M7SM33_EUTLA|nr:putative c2h2 transcription factor protein [Eutypa lata UCREL1]